jgi:DNA-3-methyladenine glycosylase
MIIKSNFYNRNTVQVAKNLLGCYLVRELKGKIFRAMITETEAYRGEYDLGCHASKGRTARNEIMYGRPGRAYVYMIYGMHYMLNVVTEEKEYPAAVLIRGILVEDAHARPEARNAHVRSLQKTRANLNGPGKLTKFLHIDKSLNGHDLTKRERLWIESASSQTKNRRRLKIIKSPRVGIDYAKHCKEWKWNFTAKV